MTHSINYYIQLSDELSTAIDKMSPDELINVATQLLSLRKSVIRQNVAGVVYNKSANSNRMFSLHLHVCENIIDLDGITTLAHGLLAKAI